MAVSYLKETVKKMAADKKLDWLPSRDGLVRELDRQLDREPDKLAEVMQKIKNEFHKDVVNKKITEFDLRAIEKETKYRLSK